jgi:V8-like Glu-specific endopeptidase
MNWNQELLRVLRRKLAFLIPTERDARALVEDAGLDPAYMDLSGTPMSRWHEVLTEAKKHRKIDDILAQAIERYPKDEMLTGLDRGEYAIITEPSMSNWRGELTLDFEKIIGVDSTLVPLSFLERGIQCSRTVGRIRLPRRGFGTGFLIHRDLLLTNNHVIESYSIAKDSWVDFNYQTNLEGQFISHQTFQLDPDLCFETSDQNEHDWTVVGVKDHPGDIFGFIPLESIHISPNAFVQVIQHPDGGEKKIAHRSNIITCVDDIYVQYLTDTLPGSSGSPVFDQLWRVVALHHAGGDLPMLNNLHSRFMCNQGININKILEGFKDRKRLSDYGV